MKVYVETNKGKLEYQVDKESRIVFLKVLIALITNTDVLNFELKFKLDTLENKETFGHYNIQDGDCLMADGHLSPSYVESQPALLPESNIRTLLSRLKALNDLLFD
jgi:hypothetical protein